MTTPLAQPRTFALSEIDTIAREIVAMVHAGEAILLSGDLGAGKTTLAKAIAAALGVHETITSPTFTLMNVYTTAHPTMKSLMHMDTYRMERPEELVEIGVDSYLGEPNTISLVEWPERFPDAWSGASRQWWFTLRGTGETRTIELATTAA